MLPRGPESKLPRKRPSPLIRDDVRVWAAGPRGSHRHGTLRAIATAVEFVITEHPSALTLLGRLPRKLLGGGYATIEVTDDRDLLDGLGPTAVVYEHHAHDVTAVPEGFVALARSEHCAVEANRSVRPPLAGHAVALRVVH